MPHQAEGKQAYSDPLSDGEREEVIFYGRLAGKPIIPQAEDRSSPDIDHSLEPTISKVPKQHPQSSRSAKEVQSPAHVSAEEAAINDYFSNLAAEDDDTLASAASFFALRDLGGSEDSHSQCPSFVGSEETVEDWAGDHLEATSISPVGDVDRKGLSMGPIVVAHRTRKKKIQYLVSPAGSSTAQPRWLSRKKVLKSNSLRTAIGYYEATRVHEETAYSPDVSEGSTPDEEEVQKDLQAAFKDAEEDDALAKDQILNMDDEHIARLVAKQEELGFDSTDLILFDDIVTDEGRTKEMKAEASRRDKISNAQRKSTARKAHSTENFAVDLRESMGLKRKGKGRRGPDLDLDAVDPLVREDLLKAWEKDRVKKKGKKREREELRSRGLLATRSRGNVDLKARYAAGMRLEDIKSEIRDFLDSQRQSIALPSMEPQARKTVHGMCHRLGLKSKSMGSGTERFPVLYKTSRTQSFHQDAFNQVRRNFFGPVGRSKKSLGTVGRAQLKRNVTDGQYRDGEVVGASAPELGEENRGRAMLEKMGWSKGTNLGATNNPGIAVPVAQVIKRSRAGLG